MKTLTEGEWEDVGPLEQMHYVCSVPTDEKFTNPGMEYPNKHKITCPAGYKVYSRACYKVFTMAKTFDDANQFCADQSPGWNGTAVVRIG